MKKIVITLGILISTPLLMAGGDVSLSLPVVSKIPDKECQENTIYIEKDTSLMWQDETYEDSEDGACKRNHSVSKAGTWGHAVNYCRGLNYAGFTDWRLPTADELVHVHRKEGQVFTYFRGDDFWSSTPASDSRYYVVYTSDAYRYKRYKSESNYIRCVRCMGSETSKKYYLLSSDPEYKTR